jgi:hypothetical protein
VNGLASFARTLVFAAAAAAAAPFALAVLRPLFGEAGALAALAIAVSAAYLLGLARRPASGLGAALALTLSGVGLVALGATPLALAALCAVLIGVLRSGLLRRDGRRGLDFGRAFALEAVLIGAGLAVGAWLARGSAFPVSLALWGFFLVQSGFFLVGGPAARAARDAADPGEVDPFEQARKRALELLEPN